MYHLGIDLHERQDTKLRVTLLSRDTQYRKILNEDELLEALMENKNYEVKKVKIYSFIYILVVEKYLRIYNLLQWLNTER